MVTSSPQSIGQAPQILQFSDIPFMNGVTAEDGAPRHDTDYMLALFNSVSQPQVSANVATLHKCVMNSCSLSSSEFRRCRFDEVVILGSKFAGTDFTQSCFSSVQFSQSVLMGCDLSNTTLNNVSFFNCKLEMVNLRAADARSIVMKDCLLREVDFSLGSLRNIRFPGSHLENIEFHSARVEQLNFVGAVSLGISSPLSQLAGAIMDREQLLSISDALAREAGLVIVD